MALDRAHKRLFIPAYGNGGYRAFRLDDNGLPLDRSAMYVIGRESLFGRRSTPPPSERELGFPGAIAVFDSSTQRLFGIDRFNNRILVFEAAPDEIARFPAATVVIGQPDFESTERGVGPRRMGMVASAALDEEGQRLFVADPPNHRVLVFDVHPDRLDSDPEATVVLGQGDFESRDAGLGPGKLAAPTSVAYDPVFRRLFVADTGNRRVLVFDADPGRLASGAAAVAVMGQPDFDSRAPRRSLDELAPESLAYDWVHHRLFIAEDLEHRIMVYDAHPDRIAYPTKAIAVIGQPDAFSTHPAVGPDRIAMPRLAVEPETQKLYVSEGFPAGNRITIFDIRPEKLRTGMAAVEVLGHETAHGGPDFENRMAQGQLHGRSLAAARALVLDRRDHRLFVADEYNHRVVVWRLDETNRVADRTARWVLGQPDLRTSLMGPPSARNMAVPLAVAYDETTRRLFVGDGYHNRVLVYEAAPDRLSSGMAASGVIGQDDFETVETGAGRRRFAFGVRMGRGIASSFLPMGLAVDEEGQRLFVSDGENNRVLVFDVARERLANGPAAIGVLGQPDFDTVAPGGGRSGLHDPGHLAYDAARGRLFVVDAQNRRVLVFDARADGFRNGAPALAVLGRSDFDAASPGGGGRAGLASLGASAERVDARRFLAPNGIAYDERHDLLYVSDARIPGDRVLVFDVAPERLENGAAAIAVLGAMDGEADPRYYGGDRAYPGQFTLRDPRGLDVDPDNGRLFVTDSFASRVVVFHFPRPAWPYGLAPGTMRTFHTPDAHDRGVKAEPFALRSARIETEGTAAPAIAVVGATRVFVDGRTERHSRMLASELAYAARRPVRGVLAFVDGAPERLHRLFVHNPGDGVARLRLRLRDPRGSLLDESEKPVPAGVTVTVDVEEHSGGAGPGRTLELDATLPVAVVGLRETTNGRGEPILAPLPAVARDDGETARPRTLPLVANGAGVRTRLVLLNDTDRPLRGELAFYDRLGARAPLGTDSDLLPYAIPPRTSAVIATDGVGPRTETGYAVLLPEEDRAPFVAALVETRAGDRLVAESLVRAFETTEARWVVDLEPTLLRHGLIDTRVVVTNPSRRAAAVRLLLEDETAVERRVPAGQQIALSVRELFGETARGILRLEADVSVAVTARQETTNLRGETVAVELPALAGDEATLFPYVPNGGGLSTELRLANPTAATLDGRLVFRRPDGEPARGTILR